MKGVISLIIISRRKKAVALYNLVDSKRIISVEKKKIMAENDIAQKYLKSSGMAM